VICASGTMKCPCVICPSGTLRYLRVLHPFFVSWMQLFFCFPIVVSLEVCQARGDVAEHHAGNLCVRETLMVWVLV